VDGKGTERVCGFLQISGNTPLNVRLARSDDESLFLDWANDPVTRENSFHKEKIEPEDHRAWFRKQLQDCVYSKLYVVEASNGIPIGQVRLTRSKDGWEIHYGLDSRCRGRGLGMSFLEAALTFVRDNSGDSTLNVFGRVKKDNIPSRKIFKQLGFSEEQAGTEFIYRQSNS
jgi:RimJ/RimL family protein N-acetyltransferase